jgi:hypothetical protein
MNQIPDVADYRLNQLAAMARLGNVEALEIAQARLEKQLQPIVRLALRTGAGIPRVVGWVQQAQARLSRGRRPAVPDEFAAEIIGMLTATLLGRSTQRAQAGDTAKGI